jgi:hypothetical protein
MTIVSIDPDIAFSSSLAEAFNFVPAASDAG